MSCRTRAGASSVHQRLVTLAYPIMSGGKANDNAQGIAAALAEAGLQDEVAAFGILHFRSGE